MYRYINKLCSIIKLYILVKQHMHILIKCQITGERT